LLKKQSEIANTGLQVTAANLLLVTEKTSTAQVSVRFLHYLCVWGYVQKSTKGFLKQFELMYIIFL